MRLANLTLEEMMEAVGWGFGSQNARAFLKIRSSAPASASRPK